MITPALATRLRALIDEMDSDVGVALADLGLVDYRNRFSAVLRWIAADGAMPIRHLAERLGVTHSAASQTVAEMQRRGLLELGSGPDARHRLVELTRKSRRIMPAVDAEWTATEIASDTLERELPYPLATLIEDLEAALVRRRFRDRIADAAAELSEMAPDLRAALENRRSE